MNDMHITVEAGKSKRLLTEGKLCDKNIVVTSPESDGGYSQGFEDGKQAGKQAEYDAFWDTYQEKGTRITYINAFYHKYWDSTTYKPKYDIVATEGSATSAFAYSRITDTIVDIDISSAKNVNGLFDSCEKLETIRKLIVSETTPFTATSFYKCKALADITIEGTIGVSISFAESPNLSDASVQSIIDALKDLTGQTGLKLTLNATVVGKMTQAQKDAITAKNWTLVS